MSSGTEKGITVQNQGAAVAQETGDSVRDSQNSTLNNMEHSSQVFTTPDNPFSRLDSYSQEQYQQFCEGNLPLPRSGDTTALSETDHARTLAITNRSKCTALALGEDLPNETATPDTMGIEKIMELRDGLNALINQLQDRCGDEKNIRCLQLAACTLGRLCSGGKGGEARGGGGSTREGNHTESVFQERHHVAKYRGSDLGSSVVTGWGRGGGREERPNGGTLRDVSVDVFPGSPANNTLPSAINQFNPNTRDQPPRSLEEKEEIEEYMGERDELFEPSFQTEPAEETAAPSLPNNFVMVETETQRDSGQPVFLSNSSQPPHLQDAAVTVLPVASSIPRSRSYEVNMTAIPLPPVPEYSGESPTPGTHPRGSPSPHEHSRKEGADDSAESQPRKIHKVKKLLPRFTVMRCSPEVKLQFLPYVMNKKKEHGLVLIIANENFRPHPHDPRRKALPRRKCASVDVDRLSELWTSLGYRVQVERDQTAEQIRKLFDVIRQERSSAKTIQEGDDSFICCISSHGTWDPALGTDVVCGVEGARVEMDGQVVVKGAVDIRALAYEKLSDACPQLKGQPKLFFIQACRGGKQGRVANSTESRTDTPPETDFLFMYATAPGKRAYRDEELGSFFITDLCAMLKQYACEHDLISILQAINQKETVMDEPYELINAKGHIQTIRQGPNFSSSLRGPVFFLNEARKRYKKYHGL